MFSNYNELEKYLNTFVMKDFTINRFQKFLSHVGNPQNKLKCIHVGGTNGKGSTTNYLYNILKEVNLLVGTFTSPALMKRDDSICVNGCAISDDSFLKIINSYYDLIIKFELTAFEIEMFVSILYFIESKVDIVIYEVGMGGLDDATNVITPIISAITNVSIDHTEFLGDTIESIANIKSGIIKKGVPFITTEDSVVCTNIFKEKCKNQKSNFIKIDKNIEFSTSDNNISYIWDGNLININTIAKYQVQNSILAINIINYLNKINVLNISIDIIKKGVSNSFWPMRFEKIKNKPLVIIDGGHNIEGINAFVESAKHYKNARIIFGAFKDKDIKNMIEKLFFVSSDIVVCPFEHYRSASLKDYESFGIVDIAESYKNAIDNALETKEVVFITGSLFFVSLAKKYILYKEEESTF